MKPTQTAGFGVFDPDAVVCPMALTPVRNTAPRALVFSQSSCSAYPGRTVPLSANDWTHVVAPYETPPVPPLAQPAVF